MDKAIIPVTNAQIKDFYDTHLDITLKELSDLTDLSITHLKLILMSED